eukprot:g7362.t1 g7362   contig24:438686-439740(+)
MMMMPTTTIVLFSSVCSAFVAPRHFVTRTPISTSIHASSLAPTAVGSRIPINEDYPGLRRVHSNPDVFVIENFLDDASCNDLIDKAREKGTSRSPVAYAGWTDDIKDLLGLAASGPVTWFAILGAWYEAQGDEEASVLSLVLHSLRNYAGLFVFAAIAVVAFTKFRADGLQNLRTSSSTTLDNLSQFGARNFVSRSEELFGPSSPPVDDVEDKNRGGQTLATLLVYLNDVENGGTTRFGKLPAADDKRQVKGELNLNIIPKKGDALLFFPADKNGMFDERTEHEGCPAVDEKWIARIWRHAGRVPPPFGLSDDSIMKYL